MALYGSSFCLVYTYLGSEESTFVVLKHVSPPSAIHSSSQTPLKTVCGVVYHPVGNCLCLHGVLFIHIHVCFLFSYILAFVPLFRISYSMPTGSNNIYIFVFNLWCDF